MASFNDSGRGDGPKQRRLDDPRRRRMSVLMMETLENRRLLSSGSTPSGGGPLWKPTNSNLLDAQNGPMANLGTDVVEAYSQYLTYVSKGAKGTFTPSVGPKIETKGNDIWLDMRGYGNFATYENALISLGMVVTATVAKYDYVEGYAPYAALPQLAEQAQTVGGAPIFPMTAYQEGSSPNQADVALNVAAARQTYGVTGAGQTIGVISTDDGSVDGGLAQSVATGDLPPNVNTVQDNSGTTDDEGRAMLEQIYDLAPGAQLAFATGLVGGDAGFANSISELYAAGARTIVDDLGSLVDPYYQDGIIQQQVNTVVANGATYLSAAGNQADSGYESQFRPVTASVSTLGAGTYMNFDPTGATTTTELGINVYDDGTEIGLQFDQPFYTANGVTSNVEIDILDQAGNLVQQANMNNVATQLPYQVTAPLAAGLYNVVIKVDSGPNPGHVLFLASGDGGFSVDTKFGSAGSTYYPSTTGHNSGAETISVGAAPFWSTPNYPHTPSLDTNEPFSSTGPVYKEFAGDGTLLPVPQLLLKPDVTSTDANNTSFFGPGEFIDTTTASNVFPANPPYPGDPATTFAEPDTATNQSVPTLENFTGTSSAAPNLAAIVALMKQANPNLTRNNILQDLISTTSPLDGIAQGAWGPQSGYGLVNALAAITAAQKLTVVSIVPGNNATVTSPPAFLTVTFNQPVNIATLTAANLLVVGANGATVTVGAPIGIDSATDPSIVEFPISIAAAPGKTGNGTYRDAIIGASITGESGEKLSSPYADQFNLEDLNGPRVSLTTYFGRVVTLAFNEALNPTTVTPNNIVLLRGGGSPNVGSNAVLVSDLPGATFTYNPINFTVTINLTNVAQSSLPSDYYTLVVSNAVTDELNNPLNGAFDGVFPSGTNPGIATGTVFIQSLGFVNLQAPIISAISLATSSDSGIVGDNNTNINTPSVTGQVTATFPGTVSGLLVYAEFNGISHTGVLAGGLDLAVGSGGRGFVGHYDVQTTTNALGQFVINYPPGVAPLPDGLNQVRVVVVGAPDLPPLPGLSSSLNTSFRVDTTDPTVGVPLGGGLSSSIVDGEQINSLSTLTLNVLDGVLPQTIGSPFAVPATFNVPALNPTTADNTSSYRLYLVNPANGALINESSFITSASFSATSARVLTSDPYTGSVTLSFAPGLPAGNYDFLAVSSVYGNGLSDAAGNPFNGGSLGTANYLINFDLQPTPTYITSYIAYTPDSSIAAQYDTSGPRAYYELPVSGVTPRADAPPTLFSIDFSNSLAAGVNYANDVELVGSSLNTAGLPTGNFGDLGITNTAGFTVISGLTVQLTNSVAGAVAGQYGFDNRLLISLPAGFTLPANYYRIYLPNTGTQAITDIYGNQLDGEFLGYQNAQGFYVDQLPDGSIRGTGAEPDLTGDGTNGGAFMTGFVVVPNGDIIYADADAVYNPLIPAQTPDGSLAKPYPVLAPEAVPNAINGGDLNSPVNAGINFDSTYDRSGDGQFEPSAFFAAQQQLALNGGPIVVVAEASVPSRDPDTGEIVQKPYVLQAPSPTGNNVATIANDASTAIPAETTLVFDPGSILKMQNAALLIQNQGSALQILGGPNSYQSVIVTSYKDDSVGGVTDGDPNSVPEAGDFGGIVFRNFSQAALPGENVARSDLFPGQIPITGDSTEDDRLKGQFNTLTPIGDETSAQVDAISGADDIMSSISYMTERYAGGSVPVTEGTQYDGVTLLNSRPAIVNSTISDSGAPGSAVAGVSVDVDSLRDDDVARGPLLRNDTFTNNALNGIYIRANQANGVAEATNAVDYPTNPTILGGSSNYILDDPYPYLLTSQMVVGQTLAVETNALTFNTDRLYITPGMLVKFETGAWLEIGQEDQASRLGFEGSNTGQGTAASLVVGDPTYIREVDADPTVSPSTPGFVANSAILPKVLFTSFYDNAATTTYTNPYTGITTTIVAALPTLPAGSVTPPPAQGNWGGIQLDAGSRDTINSAIFEYGGGFINTPSGSSTLHAIEINPFDNAGAFVSITNNTFLDNADVPINTSPDAWLAANPATPLAPFVETLLNNTTEEYSGGGAPFIHGNSFVGNGYNGVGVTGGTTGFNISNDDFNSTWTGGDFTYFLRDTIVLGPQPNPLVGTGGIPATPSSTTPVATPTPNVTLTLQSTLAGTVLADGTIVPAPGTPLVIKLLNGALTPGGLASQTPPAETLGTNPAAAESSSFEQGAGFVVGVDNGIDPPADIPDGNASPVDSGAFSDLRIVGIAADQTTGQPRVPVVITSAYNDTVGTTVNGITQNQLIPGNTTAPSAGDGGVIYFGANSLTSYNLTDPRYGSIIDNADISDITRIEQQGGGIVYGFSLLGTNALTPSYETLFGLPQGGGVNLADQYNAPKSITVSNSNLSNFSSAGFYAHPGHGSIIIPINYISTTPLGIRDTSFNGEPTHDYFYNDTFSNMPTAVYILSQAGADIGSGGPFPTPSEAVFLNDDFYKDTIGIDTNGQGPGQFSHVALLAMDSIFDNIVAPATAPAGTQTGAIILNGKNYGGSQNEGQNNVVTLLGAQILYDDFYANTNNVTNVNVTGALPTISGGPTGTGYFGNPEFRDPATGNFFLLPASTVIDVARSELGPTIFGDMLYPAVNYATTATGALDPTTPAIRNEPVTVGGVFALFGQIDQTKPAGDINFSGGLNDFNFAGGPTTAPYVADEVTLPGRPYNSVVYGNPSVIPYPDQWIAQTISSGLGTQGTAGNISTYTYEPVVGQRDQVGDLRVPDPNSHNVGGYGAKPYFDLGAIEYIVQNPPIVEAVGATTKNGLTSIYGVGTIDGVNTLPTSISFLFNEQLNPLTITGMSVILEQSGDGVFGDPNDPTDRTISLTGLLSFDDADDVLTINTTSIFTSLASANDEYRIILKGSGSSVIRDNSGLALDGTNLDANGNQLPLPSGADNFPGSDFQVTFSIDTHAPSVVPGTFKLSPTSDSSGGLNITNVTQPTFVGTITDVFPPANFLQGQTVFIDVSTLGNGVFNDLNAGVGTTNAAGQFSVTISSPLPDTPNKVGTNGIQVGPGSSITYVRVRVEDQDGNFSDLPTDSIQTYAANGALTGLQIDTVKPKVAAFAPTASTVVTPSNGEVVFTSVFTKNIKSSTLNTNSILVYRTGGTGTFGAPVQVPLIPGSVAIAYSTNPLTLGYEIVTFAIASTQPNDEYEVVLKGTGANPITDLAGNPLDGKGIGAGSDYTSGPVILFSSSNAQLIYVAPVGTEGTGVAGAVQGTRENPFTTIGAAMNAALIGDDVLVLPGTYEEDVTLKAGVRLLSAGLGSTDTTFTAGSPYETLIYGVANPLLATGAGNNTTTLFATGSVPGIPTEVSGFAIISPLIGDSNLGTIDSTDVAVRTFDSNAEIDRNIIVNAGIGIYLSTEGSNSATSDVFDNLIAGNIIGVLVSDLGATTSVQSPFMVVNNTIADNTYGLTNISSKYNVTQAYVINNIFYSNHTLSTQRSGTGINSSQVDTLAVGNNLFYQNGVTNSAASNATGTFVGFNPATLSGTPDALGNLLGNPYFVQAEDPRPNGDTPATFFTYSDFDLTSRSIAINAADGGLAPASDILYRTPVFIAGHGFPGTGPASIGAYYYDGLTGASGGTGTTYTGTGSTGTGTGTGSTGSTNSKPGSAGSPFSNDVAPTVSAESVSSGMTANTATVSSPIGGGIALDTKQFTVVNTSLTSGGTADTLATSTGVTTEPGPAYIDINFSDDVKASSLSPTDLVLSGTGLGATNPAHPTNFAWIDDHAVRFYLSGGYTNGGSVKFSIPEGAITDTSGAALVGFNNTITIGTAPVPPTTPVTTTTTTSTVTPTTLLAGVLPVAQPVAAAAPVSAESAAPMASLPTPVAPTNPTEKLTPKQLKQQEAAQAKAEKAAKAAEAKAEKVEKAVEAKAAKVAKAAAAAAYKAAKKAK